jgi:integrase/recombinase XerD
MPYRYVREPLTAEEADQLANASETLTEQLIVWTLLDTGLRVGELCALTTKDVLWQQRQFRVRGKGGPYGQKSKVRVVPKARRVRALPAHHFALHEEFPVRTRRAQGLVKEVANRAGLTKDVTPHVLRHTFAATALQKGISLATAQKIRGHDQLSALKPRPSGCGSIESSIHFRNGGRSSI